MNHKLIKVLMIIGLVGTAQLPVAIASEDEEFDFAKIFGDRGIVQYKADRGVIQYKNDCWDQQNKKKPLEELLKDNKSVMTIRESKEDVLLSESNLEIREQIKTNVSREEESSSPTFVVLDDE